MNAANGFALRLATVADVPALHALIEASVRGLQAGDYTPSQIEGALGTALGLDTQLIADGTYFVAEAEASEEILSGAEAATEIAPFESERASGDCDTARIRGERYSAAADGRVLAGCGGWSKRKTLFGADRGPVREPELLDPATDAAKVRAIFVHPEFARRGLGSLILARVEAEARGGISAIRDGIDADGIAALSAQGLCGGGTDRGSAVEW